MRFEDFIRIKKVRKGKPDTQLAKSLVKMSESHIEYLEEIMEKIKLTETNSSIIMTNYYESLREIIEAVAATEGYKVYSHEAFTYLLKEMGEDTTSLKFDRYRKMRNGVNYYGEPVEKSVTEAAVKDIREMIAALKEKFLKDI